LRPIIAKNAAATIDSQPIISITKGYLEAPD
jgi:hypothetical protein